MLWKKIYPVIFEKKSFARFFRFVPYIIPFWFLFIREFICVRLLTLYNLKPLFNFSPCSSTVIFIKKIFWLALTLSSFEFIHNVISRRRRFVAENENYKSEINVFRSRIGRSIVGINKSLTDTWMWKLGLWPRNSFSGNLFRIFGIGSLQGRAGFTTNAYINDSSVVSPRADLRNINS